MQNAVKQLALADPELAAAVLKGLEEKETPVSSSSAAMLVDETIWGLSREISFGYAIAEGYLKLIGRIDPGDIYLYRGLVRNAGLRGPTLGRIMATHLAQVLLRGNRIIIEKFLGALKVMRSKGEHILSAPLESLSEMLEGDDLESAAGYCDLLGDLFSQDIAYNRCRHFASAIPKAVLSFPAARRPVQIRELRRIIRQSPDLSDNFLKGMEQGLALLSGEALHDFICRGLIKFRTNKKYGEKFLSLESRTGIEACYSLQTAVSIKGVSHQLNRYLQARTGLSLSVQVISGLPDSLRKALPEEIMVCSDGRFIYLPEEVDFFPDRDANLNLYKALTKIEAGCHEFGTFDFDLDRLRDTCGAIDPDFKDGHANISDLELFFSLFPVRNLAEDLFTIIEHGRLKALSANRYPGLIKRILPLLQAEAGRICRREPSPDPLFPLYALIALDMPREGFVRTESALMDYIMQVAECWKEEFNNNAGVEKSAEFTFKIYAQMEALLKAALPSGGPGAFYQPLRVPFGRSIRPELFFFRHLNFEKTAARMRLLLKKNGFKIYKSDVRKRLVDNNGVLSLNDIEEIIISSDPGLRSDRKVSIDLSGIDLEGLVGRSDTNTAQASEPAGLVSRYAEWDYTLGDYLKDHVRVTDKIISGEQSSFYEAVLKQYQGLVTKIRYSFELLKPESLQILRQWIEGDEFDYRALLDFAIDQKAGLTPSERLYIKRIKQERDVAVLLLVDLSRSTANRVSGLKKRVLDVEKEAVVLFCEALDVVGDSFAVAGFSGTGRFGVDYFNIKGFEEALEPEIKNRINALTPQRSTRMGAAIRHAVSRLEKKKSKVRLLLVIGDGFPNDLDYKQKYAIEDTRKAMQEARSKNIYARAITVNIPGDPALDALYGETNHNVISDINELPDNLLHIYRSLTACS